MSRMTPEMRARLDAFKAIKVKHPRLEEVDRSMTRAIYEHTSYSILTLYGPSGAGKSTATKRIAERSLEGERNRAIVPVVYVEARPGDIGAYARLDYYRQVVAQLREHAAVKDRMMNLALASRSTKKSNDVSEWLDMREGVEYCLERLGVKAVFVDEAQHLMRVEPPHKPVEQLDWLKSLTNRTNVLHVLVGNYEMYEFCHLNGQAARRGRDLHFPRYHLDTKTECEEFVGALQYLLERVPLQCDVPGLLTHWRWFGEWSLGCIGILRDWVVETVSALCEEGGTTLTIEALKRHALQADQRLRLEMEARTGEHKVEQEKARSEQQLQDLLGNAAKTLPNNTDFQVNGSSQIETLPLGKPNNTQRKTTRKPAIERAAERDPVGVEVLVNRKIKCSFSGIIEISAVAMEECGVSRVECPECATVRSLTPRGQTVRFPPHDKRKTSTPNVDSRWTKPGMTWGVVGR